MVGLGLLQIGSGASSLNLGEATHVGNAITAGRDTFRREWCWMYIIAVGAALPTPTRPKAATCTPHRGFSTLCIDDEVVGDV